MSIYHLYVYLSVLDVLLYEFPGGNQVDGLPPASSTEPRWIGLALDPRLSMILVVGLMFFNDVVYYELLVCYIQILQNIIT